MDLVGVVGYLPSDDSWLPPFSHVWDAEKPEDRVYDPEIINRWYWVQQGNDFAYYVERA